KRANHTNDPILEAPAAMSAPSYMCWIGNAKGIVALTPHEGNLPDSRSPPHGNCIPLTRNRQEILAAPIMQTPWGWTRAVGWVRVGERHIGTELMLSSG